MSQACFLADVFKDDWTRLDKAARSNGPMLCVKNRRVRACGILNTSAGCRLRGLVAGLTLWRSARSCCLRKGKRGNPSRQQSHESSRAKYSKHGSKYKGAGWAQVSIERWMPAQPAIVRMLCRAPYVPACVPEDGLTSDAVQPLLPLINVADPISAPELSRATLGYAVFISVVFAQSGRPDMP